MRGTAAGSHPRQGLRTVHVAPAGASLPSAVAASLRKSRPGQGAEAECFLAACLYATEPDSPCSGTGGLSLRVHGLEIPATALRSLSWDSFLPRTHHHGVCLWERALSAPVFASSWYGGQWGRPFTFIHISPRVY